MRKVIEVAIVVAQAIPIVSWIGARVVEAREKESDGGKTVTADEAADIVNGAGERIATFLRSLD